MLKRRKSTNDLVLFRNMGGFLAFADLCVHPRKFLNNGVYFVDYGICLQPCKDVKNCRIYWNRKDRLTKAIELNGNLIDIETVREELNGKV